MHRRLLVPVVAIAAWALVACGSSGGSGGQDVSTDTPVEATPDVPEVQDEPEVTPDTPPEAEVEQIAFVCAPATVKDDCKDTVAPDDCHEVWCDTAVPGGKCDIRAKQDGTDCDDGEACTEGDVCTAGACTPGKDRCECTADAPERCADKEDGNLCNGTLKCDVEHFPYKCVVDETTIPAACPTDQNTACSVSTCKPETGLCEMAPVNEGGDCPDNNVCTLKTVCEAGACVSKEDKVCEDYLDVEEQVPNLCTTNSCDPVLGCVYKPNTDPCEDGNECTVDDACKDGACKAGPKRNCDDQDFCTDDTCDPAVIGGCVHTDHSCDDGIPCTDDSCDSVEGKCVHAWRDDAVEGAKGAASCGDTVDNDCDGDTDEDDAQCLLSVARATPSEGPSAGGSTVVLEGQSLDLLAAEGNVTFAGVDVPFTVLSPTQIRITTPPHATQMVSVTVSDGTVAFTADDVFLYTGKVPDDSPILAVLLDPATHEMKEGETSPSYLATVTIPGVTDVGTPDATGVKAQIGWGTRGTNPWEDPSWQWVDAALLDTTGGSFMYQQKLTLAVGGLLHVAARFSLDGGITWQFGDMDGSANGYDPAFASVLTVWGVAQVGEIVINEIMWMGAKGAPFDEWFELRNMTPAPFDLKGYKVTGAGPTGSDFVLDAPTHDVRNLVLEPWGYFLVAEYDAEKVGSLPASALDMLPDVVGKNTMVLPNPSPSQPSLYKLIAADAKVIDLVICNGSSGELPTIPDKPVRSMERNKVPGDGTKDSSWHSATVKTGWDNDPKQAVNYGTPGAANSDIPVCAADAVCEGAFPKVEIGQCEKEVCDMAVARCDIRPIADGEACDDGLYCNVDEVCVGGTCGGGVARDCSDESPCTLDTCLEDDDECVSSPDPAAVEGPAMSASCGDGIDNDCDDTTDGDDAQCRLKVESVEPAVVPCTANWVLTLKGAGFELPVVEVKFGTYDATAYTIDDDMTVTAGAPFFDAAGDYDVAVSDGEVTAVLANGLRCIDLDPAMWANTQFPVDPFTITAGESTGLIYGRVWADGVTNVDPKDPTKLIAEIGVGPAGGDPFREEGWMWFPATYNDQCLDCGENFEFMAEMTAQQAGIFSIAFRFSADGGYHWQFGDTGDGSADGWSGDKALTITVLEPPPPG
jgi:hypothetical protein